MEFTEKRGHICEKGPVIRLHGNNSSIPSQKESDVIFLGNYTLRKGKYFNNFFRIIEYSIQNDTDIWTSEGLSCLTSLISAYGVLAKVCLQWVSWVHKAFL